MGEIDDLISEFTSGDDQRAESAAFRLAALGPEALPALIKELLVSSQTDVRWWAVRALSELKDPQVPVLLVQMLSDPDPSVRHCAALGLRQNPDPAAVHPLAAALESGDPELSHLAGYALVAIGKPALPALIETLGTGSQSAQIAALRAVAEIGDHSAIPALMEALKKDSVLMEYWANEGLDRLGLGMSYFKT